MDAACREARICAAESPPGTDGASDHLASCPSCVAWWGEACTALGAIRAAPGWGAAPLCAGPAGRPRVAWGARTGLAAAAAVAAAVCAVWGVTRHPPARVDALQGCVEIQGAVASVGSAWETGQTLRTGADGRATVALRDGTAITVQESAVLEREPAVAGERERVRLRTGEVRVHACPGALPLVIAVPQGRVRVLGTVLFVAVHAQEEAGGTPLPSFSVIEVLTGVVEVDAGGRSEMLPAGTRGILLASESPLRQEIPSIAPGDEERRRLRSQAGDCAARGDVRGAALLLAAARERATALRSGGGE